VAFARKIVEAHGRITDADLAEIRLADFSDGQIVEIVANVAINVLTNLLGIVADTDIDFPVVRAEAA
jgi:alkylhydroperoxidase family enzyme